MSFDVFISYSAKDKPTADAACAALEAAQVRCWIAPRDILPGADWGASIIEALDRCRVMVLIFSASANDSPQIRNEVVHAVQRGVPVIPVRIEDTAPAKSLAYFMGAVHWLDALSPPLEVHLKRLAETVRAMLQLVPASEQSAAPAAAAGEAPLSVSGVGTRPLATVLEAAPGPAATPGKDRGAHSPARRGRVAIAAAASAGLLIVAAMALYLSPLRERWFQPKAAPPQVATSVVPAQPPPSPASPAELLLARLALALPSVSQQSREQRVRDYAQAREHKAQAMSLQPPGTWRATGRASPQIAEEAALENCQVFFGQPCAIIAVNDRVLPVPADGTWPRRDMPRVRYAGNFDPNQIPSSEHLRQRPDIAGYAAATGPKAVAYHPSTGVFVVTGAESQRLAEEKVLETCNNDPKRPASDGLCFLYAIGNQIVLPQRRQKPMS